MLHLLLRVLMATIRFLDYFDCFTCNGTTVTCVRLDTCDTTTVPPEPEAETNQNSPENGLSPLILGAVGGACVFFVITVAICIAMKCKSNNDRKNRTDYEQPGFMEKPNYEQPRFMDKKWIPVNAPPIGTSFPPDYKRGFSNVSLGWTDNSRPKTPVDIFTVKGYN